MIDIPKMPKMPTVADLIADMPEIGPPVALEQMEKMNATMAKVLEQLTLIQGWLVKIEGNTRKSGFTP